MKLSIDVTVLAFPLTKAIKTNLRSFDQVDALVVFLRYKDFVGTSFIRGLGPLPVKEIVEEIRQFQLVLEASLMELSEEQWRSFWSTYRANKSKPVIYALAAIDIAVWDLFAKQNNQSLYQLLGKEPKQRIAVYGTTGWLSLSTNELIAECEKYAKLGINAFKIRLGHTNDYERVKAVRSAMGENFTIMLDANQQYTVSEAMAVAKRMEPLNIAWLEEPVEGALSDLMMMSHASSIPIAIGENIFDIEGFSEICKEKAAAILQPDIIRCGGVTGFMNIAEITEKYKMPLCNHLLPQLSVSSLALFSNAFMLEYDDLIPEEIFTQDFSIKDGLMRVPDRPGVGVELTRAAIEKYSLK